MSDLPSYGLKSPKLWQIALLCYWLALFVGTHIPKGGPGLPTNNLDKPAHLAAYAGLAALMAVTWQLSAGHLTTRHLAWLWLVIVVYAGFDEWTQKFVGRDSSVWDWIADAVGALVALLLFVWWRRRQAPHP